MNVVKFRYIEVIFYILYYTSFVTKRTSRFVLLRFPVSPDSSRYMDDLITKRSGKFWKYISTLKKQVSSYFFKVLILPAQFFLTLSNSPFLRAESTNLQPYLDSS